MTVVLEYLGAALMVIGSLVVAIAALGVVRLGDPFMRMHAATKAGVVGAGIVLLGSGLALGTVSGVLTALAGLVFLLVTSPIASHVLGRAAYVAGAPLSATTSVDALLGILPRNIIDLEAARVARPRSFLPPDPKERTMTALPFREPSTSPAAAPTSVRRVAVWLAGGPAQADATACALDLAQGAGAQVVGLSAIDPAAADYRGPLPIGGGYWARWLAERQRAHMRGAAAEALRQFEGLAGQSPVATGTRHEEGGLDALAPTLAGVDLLVVPAAIDQAARPQPVTDELATKVSRNAITAVLRVAQRPSAVRRVLVVVGATPNCPRLAHALAGLGLWRSARVVVAPAREDKTCRELAAAQADLLTSHGWDAVTDEPFDLGVGERRLTERLRSFDVAVLGALSSRQGWFGAAGGDVHEAVVQAVPVVLLP